MDAKIFPCITSASLIAHNVSVTSFRAVIISFEVKSAMHRGLSGRQGCNLKPSTRPAALAASPSLAPAISHLPHNVFLRFSFSAYTTDPESVISISYQPHNIVSVSDAVVRTLERGTGPTTCLSARTPALKKKIVRRHVIWAEQHYALKLTL